MVTKIASILAAALILGLVSIASAAAIQKPVTHHRNHPATILSYRQAIDVFANF